MVVAVFEKQIEHSYNLDMPDPYAMTKLGLYLKDDHPLDINRVLSSRMDQAYPSYMNVQSVSQIPQQPPNYSVNTGFTVFH